VLKPVLDASERQFNRKFSFWFFVVFLVEMKFLGTGMIEKKI
jgi:hypothetical protein